MAIHLNKINQMQVYIIHEFGKWSVRVLLLEKNRPTPKKDEILALVPIFALGLTLFRAPLNYSSCFKVDSTESTEVQNRLVYCYPVRLSIQSPPQPRVELHFENDIACLRYKGEMVKVNRGHFNKLVCTC